MTIQQTLIDYLSKTLGKSNESISELLFKKSDGGTLTDEINEDALESLEALHAQHVTTADAEALKLEYDKGHKQGKFEGLSKVEADLKKTFNVDGKNINEIAANIAKKSSEDAGTDDKVLTHPLYIKLKSESNDSIQAVKAEYETKLTEVSTKAERQARFSANLSKIEQAMQEAGVVLPKNPAAASKIKEAFLAEFSGFDFDGQETGTYLKDAEGKLVKDKHGHPVTVEAFTKQKVAEWFDIEKQPARQTPGADPANPANPPSKWTKDNLPKTPDEYEKAYYATTDPAERTELTKLFQETVKAT